MVPYVRKSFYKHFKDGIVYIENLGLEDFENRYIHDSLPITDKIYQSGCYKKAYKYAMDMTEKEIHQAVEGLYHNLNTLQSRSGN